MKFPEQYLKAQIILVNTEVVVPSGHETESHIVIPDSIVNFCIDRYGLCEDGVRGIDPMCGLGTIPRVINAQGGQCWGIEKDERRYTTTASVVDPTYLYLGDFRQHPLEDQYNYVFTSMPFEWFENSRSVKMLNPRYARRLRRFLSSDGFLLLDTVWKAQREGVERNIAESQSQYLEKHGFSLEETFIFESGNPHSDNQSIILKFSPTKHR